MGDHLATEIGQVSNDIEISPYLWQIIENPAVRTKLDGLLDREQAAANGDFETSYKHSIDLAKLAESYAGYQELAGEQKDIFIIASLLHDIGKKEVPLGVLVKNGRLSDDEREIINRHAVDSWKECCDIADSLPDDDLDKGKFLMVSEIILRHHRPGTGESYPDDEFLQHHLDDNPKSAEFFEDKGRAADIEKMANMISVIDVYDSLRSVRPYREPAKLAEVEFILKSKFPAADYPKEQELINFLINKLEK